MSEMEANNASTGLSIPLGLYRVDSDATTNDDAPTEYPSPPPASASGTVDGFENWTSGDESTPTPTTPTSSPTTPTFPAGPAASTSFPTAPLTPPAASSSRLRQREVSSGSTVQPAQKKTKGKGKEKGGKEEVHERLQAAFRVQSDLQRQRAELQGQVAEAQRQLAEVDDSLAATDVEIEVLYAEL